MKFTAEAAPGRFLERARSHLLRDEARHNLILGIAGTLVEHPDAYRTAFLWLVEDEGNVVCAGLMTPPFNAVVSAEREDGALVLLAREVGARSISLPGVTGAIPESERFAEAWTRETNARARRHMAHGIYALTRVRPAPPCSGRPRRADRSDRELLRRWVGAFVDETAVSADREHMVRTVDRRLAGDDEGLWLWEDDGPASMAGFGGATPNGIRIGPVFTPPERRGRGYATALVASLSGWLLRRERRFCFLYTDLANPTSNEIYRRIGYEFVCDAADIRFEAPPGTAG
jgi:predicted GNAT family acetyltransferase